MNSEKTYSYQQASKLTGLTTRKIRHLVAENAISEEDGRLPQESIDCILQEKQDFISFSDYAAMHVNERFLNTAPDRAKLLTILENNRFFGIEPIAPYDLMTGNEKELLYFWRSDVPALDSELGEFFGQFALTEQDKIDQIIRQTSGHYNTKIYLEKYRRMVLLNEPPTPGVTEFVGLILTVPDVLLVTTADLKKLFSKNMSGIAKKHLVRFLNFVRMSADVKYGTIAEKKEEARPIPAYSDDTYLRIAKCVFSANYIAEHQMIERALETPLFIETWLFLAVFFTCGWRAQDICRGWKYLNLNMKGDNPYGIKTETLYDDILYDRLPDSLYENVCDYAVTSIKVSGMMPSKTAEHNPTTLTAFVTPELKTFYGLLTLIAEAVHMKTGEGYMRPERTPQYQSKITLRNFFGDEMYEAIGGMNLHSRRLNKDFLQGIEETARQNGCGGIMASAVASFARNHTNLDTIAHYLHDHTLSGENAEMTLFFMLDRGVFGFEKYQTLLTAYPELLKKLPLQKQNELIKALEDSPYQIEMIQSGEAAGLHVQESFQKGKNTEVIQMLKDMFEISQGRGEARDEGIYCTLRARNELCAFPEFDSCLANACPYLVFTRYGYLPLLNTLKEYVDAARDGDTKAANILEQVLLPRYREIINTVMQDAGMKKEERIGMKNLMEEILQ